MKNYNIPPQIQGGSNKCYAIKRNGIKRGFYTILDHWKYGFYNVPDPKLFLSEQEAEKYIKENSLKECKVVKGTFDPSQGFLMNNR